MTTMVKKEPVLPTGSSYCHWWRRGRVELSLKQCCALCDTGLWFNGKLRTEVPAREIFITLKKAMGLIEQWRSEYNQVHPHGGLGCRLSAAEARTSGVCVVQKGGKAGVEEMAITELHEKMDSDEYSARAVTERYLERIEEIDKQGPKLNAIIELNPDALEIADSLDAERKEKGVRSLMHGIPVVLKDNIDTGDRMMTTAGSLALVGSIAPRDSFVAQKLREAGAVILGKANLTEWANFRGRNPIDGWSSRGGLTRNP